MILSKGRLVLVTLIIAFISGFGQNKNITLKDFVVERIIDASGKEIVGIVVPGIPPEKHREPVATPTRSAVLLDYVPAFDWSFGCSATSASMIAGYYDNNGYPDMYSGPTNNGFMPMNNSSWGYVMINGELRALCPLSATRNGLDGRTTRGHVDDYWIASGDTTSDPFIVNGWSEHTSGDCTGDFMKTNQSVYNNSDGSTTFYYYTNGSPLSSTTPADGCYGLNLFYESRGYDVVAYYSQFIYGWEGNTIGFTFNQYKQEINNGRPVLIQVEGHTMVGYGYDDNGSVVYLHDTWDYSSHTMTWGDSYAGMAHYGVSVVQLEPAEYDILANFTADTTQLLVNSTVSFTDMTFGNPTSWSWSLSPSTYSFTGGTSASSQNPQVQFTAGGYYTVSLTASDGVNSDTETKTSCILAIDCSLFPFPLYEDFSGQQLPQCWQNIDHQGNGQVWQFTIPSPIYGISTGTLYNGLAILNSDAYGDGNSQNADLVTPALDLSSYTSVNLYFQHYFRQWTGSSGTLSCSINGGGTWSVIQTWTSTTDNPAIFNQSIPQVAGQSNVKFKWNYIGNWGYFWAVDDIAITGTAPGLWNGTTSGNWNTASNWGDGAVPGSTTNVIVPVAAPNWPVYSGNLTLGAQCRNVTLNAGSRLTITGNLTIPANRQFTITGNGILEVGGSIFK